MSTPSDRRTVITVGLALAAGVLVGLIYFQTHPPDLASYPSDSLATASRTRAGMPDRELPPGTESNRSLGAGADRTTDLSSDAEGLSMAVARIETGRGVIRFRCFREAAPRTCQRISDLISSRFYNGLVFHRVIPGFVIQAGDPTGTGSGGSGQLIPREPNDLQHEEGAIGLAHESYDPNSGDSQFYITLSPQPHLDGKFTIFGKVVEGMEVAKRIEKGDRIISLRWE